MKKQLLMDILEENQRKMDHFSWEKTDKADIFNK